MTQQYLAGELSVRLRELQEKIEDEVASREIAELRHQVEAGPLPGLPCAILHALDMCDRSCWESLIEGDSASFNERAQVCVELWEFGRCAGLVKGAKVEDLR